MFLKHNNIEVQKLYPLFENASQMQYYKTKLQQKSIKFLSQNLPSLHLPSYQFVNFPCRSCWDQVIGEFDRNLTIINKHSSFRNSPSSFTVNNTTFDNLGRKCYSTRHRTLLRNFTPQCASWRRQYWKVSHSAILLDHSTRKWRLPYALEKILDL